MPARDTDRYWYEVALRSGVIIVLFYMLPDRQDQ